MGSSVKLEDITTKLNREEAQFHKENVADLLQRPNLNFPGAQPVSFARRHLEELEHVDYYVAEKTDGIRCLLFLTQIFDEVKGPQEQQFLIDRKNDYYAIHQGFLHLPPPNYDFLAKRVQKPEYNIHEWHLGTIIDGELVQQRLPDGKEQLTYLIFDLLAVDSKSITERTYDTRIGKVKGLIYEPWKAFRRDWPKEVEVQPFQLKLKEPQFGYGIEMMFKEILPGLPHGNDGLIFTCRETAYVSGTDQHILKWKPPHENTVDFRLALGEFPKEIDDEGEYEDFDQKPEFELQEFMGDRKYRRYASLYITDAEWEAMKGMNESFDYRIIECWREAGTGRWRPKLDGKIPRFRDDKDNANHHSTVESVIESIEDAVTEEDLMARQTRLRDAWKARDKIKKHKEAEMKMRQQQQQKQGLSAPKPPAGRTASAEGEVKKEAEEDDGPMYVD